MVSVHETKTVAHGTCHAWNPNAFPSSIPMSVPSPSSWPPPSPSKFPRIMIAREALGSRWLVSFCNPLLNVRS